MPFYSCRPGLSRFRLVLASFVQHPNLHFASALAEDTITQAFADAQANFAQDEDDVYTPALTLWAFLSQVLYLGPMRSCAAAVGRVVVLMIALGKQPCSDNTGAYCRARNKLPLAVLARLTTDLANGCEQRLPQRWLWKGRHVHLVDGTTASMPDTADNQQAFPQHRAQAPGVGFPLARMVVLLSLATAMVKAMALGPYQGKETGETALLRELLGHFTSGDILLADRYYCSYFLIALFQELGVDFVVRLHQCRDYDFRRGRHLGPGDHIVRWLKPAKPKWMDQETYDRLPASLEVREVQVQVQQPGFRTEFLVVVTTLLDAEEYAKEDIAELYHRRWLIELDIRTLKITLGMDVLRCQSPDMVRREIWTCLLAYNLIRQTMLEAALQTDRSPRELSFTAALQKIAAAWAVLSTAEDSLLVSLIDALLTDLTTHRVGNRPNRVEPRKIKRRPKSQELLTEPREQARAKLYQGNNA
jgi:DDE family transposase